MKTLHCKVRGYLLMLALVECTTVLLPAQTCPPSKLSFDKELSIRVGQYPYRINSNTVDKHEKMFLKRIRFKNNTQVPGPLKVSVSSVISKLYCDAEAYRSTNCADGECVTGVWIYFGIKTGKLTFFFQPSVFRALEAPDGSNLFSFIATPFVGKVYEYVGPTSEFKEDTNFGDHQKLYFQNFEVRRHSDSENHKPGNHQNDGTTWEGDAQKVFYTFQEILGFYYETFPLDNNGFLFVHNSAANFRIGSQPWRAKHNTFIKVGDSTERIAKTAVSDDAANLAHVCPSRCNTLEYPGQQFNKKRLPENAFQKQNSRNNR